MTPEEAERAIAGPVQRFGQRFMLDPTFYAPAIESGYHGYDFYVTGRGGVLGEVDADVVEAAFGFLHGGFVRTMWDQGRAVEPVAAAAERFAAGCADWGRAHLAPDVDYAALSPLLGRVIAAAPVAGMALFAGWRNVALPDDPMGAVAQQINVLREFRGGAHIIGVMAAGLSPLAAVVAKGGEANAALLGHSAPLPDVSALREATDRAETITDIIAAQPFAELDEAELELVVTSLLAALLPIG